MNGIVELSIVPRERSIARLVVAISPQAPGVVLEKPAQANREPRLVGSLLPQVLARYGLSLPEVECIPADELLSEEISQGPDNEGMRDTASFVHALGTDGGRVGGTGWRRGDHGAVD
jgi:hypothetical protein